MHDTKLDVYASSQVGAIAQDMVAFREEITNMQAQIQSYRGAVKNLHNWMASLFNQLHAVTSLLTGQNDYQLSSVEIVTSLTNDQNAQQSAMQKSKATIQEVTQRDNIPTSVKLSNAGSIKYCFNPSHLTVDEQRLLYRG